MSTNTHNDALQFANAVRSARSAFAKGENIQKHLEIKFGLPRQQAIEIAYSLQAGSYTKAAGINSVKIFHETCMNVLARHVGETLNKRCLDFGVGEGTAWARVNSPKFSMLYGLDVSYRRLHWCKHNISDLQNLISIKSDGTVLPFADRSVDFVTTMHSLESNCDSDAQAILHELARISNEFIFLFEPNYETAHESMRQHMSTHRYNTSTWRTARCLADFNILDDFQFEQSINPDNTTSCLVLRRSQVTANICADDEILVCPLSRNPVYEDGAMFVDSSGTFGYPRYKGTYFLNPSDAIFIDDVD